ncbi:MAG TPA: chemotaxis protein CheW [Nitrospirota bacterium]|nr:chemotaxis protein CheW [Nitrospirota bacterium]
MDILAARKKAAERAQAHKAEDAALPADMPVAPAEEALVHTTGSPPPLTVPESAEPQAVQPVPQVVSEKPEIPAQNSQEETQELEMVSFRLGSEEYAVLVADVREVLKIRELTRVPNAPDYILGITSLRGTMLPVIDLCRRLGLKPTEPSEKARIIVISTDDDEVGLVVDRVNSVIRVPLQEIKPAPEHIEQGADFLRGIVRQGDKLYIVLDLHKAVVK